MLRIHQKIILTVCCTIVTVTARTEPFILGADISWIPARETSGVRYADNGTVKDIFEILRDHRFNWIRLRLFVDPTAKIQGESESPYSTQGYCGLEQTRAMAKRIKNAGMMFLLDFHYSDTWADPAKQYKPVSWGGLSFNQLVEKVRSYTRETLEAFKADGTLPDMVQVGNEIVGGMIWPDGRIANMSNFAALVNAGIDGVKDVDTGIPIMIHSISERSPSGWLTSLVNAGVRRIDVFGLSYYSEWHGTPNDLQQRVNAVIANHKVKIVIAEYADNHRQANDIIYNLPDGRGLGTFVWEPTDWKEALFDWKNGRRETNSRIDLYPQLSKEYGNDDIVAINKKTGQISLHPDNARAGGFARLNGDNYQLHDYGKTAISLFTLQGRLIQRLQMSLPDAYNLIANKHGKQIPPGGFLLIIKEKGGEQRAYRLKK